MLLVTTHPNSWPRARVLMRVASAGCMNPRRRARLERRPCRRLCRERVMIETPASALPPERSVRLAAIQPHCQALGFVLSHICL